MNTLEQSLADLREQHGLDRIDIGLSVRRFISTVWWRGFSRTACSCAYGHGDTIAEAVANALANANSDRAPIVWEPADESVEVSL